MSALAWGANRKVQLRIQREGESDREIPIEFSLTDGVAWIGRGDDCGVRLEDRAVSRRHAELRLIEGGEGGGDKLQVRRKAEFAPIQFNGEERDEATLGPGDVLSVGPYRIHLVGEEIGAAAGIPAGDPMAIAPSTSAPASAAVTGPVINPAPVAIVPEAQAATVSEDPGALEVVAESTPASLELESADGLSGQPSNGLEFEGQAPVEGGGEVDGMPKDATQVGGISLQGVGGAAGADSDADGRTRVGVSAGIEFILKVSGGAADVEEFRIEKDEVRIGRGKSCDLVLKDKKASRVHAILRRAGMRISLVDQGSSHGTLVNGEKITEQEIYSDDVIQIGESRLTLVARDPNYEAAAQGFAQVPAALQSYGTGPDGLEPSSSDAGAMEMDAGMAPASDGGLDGFSGIGGPGGVQGLETAPIQAAPGGKKTLLQRYRELPPEKQRLVAIGAVVLAFLMTQVPDEEDQSALNKKKAQSAQVQNVGGPKGYAQLSAEERAVVDSAYKSAQNYFATEEYELVIREVKKVLSLLPDHEDAKNLGELAARGQQRVDAERRDREKKENELRLKARIQTLVAEIGTLMEAKKYAEAEGRFSELIDIDVDNKEILKWKREIRDHEEQIEAERQRKIRIEDMRAAVRRQFAVADELRKAGRFKEAIVEYAKVENFGYEEDSKTAAVLRKAKAMIEECKKGIADRRDPLLAEARQAEEAGDFASAYATYEKAKKADPDHPGGQEGMDRVRGALNLRAKVAYTEAVLAESFSDFSTARSKFEEVLRIAPKDDKAPESYYQRAQRKLASYLHLGPESPTAEAGGPPPGGP